MDEKKKKEEIMGRLSKLDWSLDELTNFVLEEVQKSKSNDTAWCEKCGDSLETKPIFKKLDKPIVMEGKKITEVIDHYEYYCFGCDDTYKLVLIKEHDYSKI